MNTSSTDASTGVSLTAIPEQPDILKVSIDYLSAGFAEIASNVSSYYRYDIDLAPSIVSAFHCDTHLFYHLRTYIHNI